MNDGPFVLGIDASTTACKAIVWDLTGGAVASGRATIELHNPVVGGYEQDAEEWWSAFVLSVRRALESFAHPAETIVALSIANQRETFVLTDPEGRPLTPALVWMDSRCRDEVREVVSKFGAETIHRITGKPPCTTPSLYKLLFLLRRKAPELAGKRFRMLDVHAFLAWRLTGRRATSVASADPTGLVDLQGRCWSEPVLDLVGLKRENLPELVAPGKPIGGISTRGARETGLPVGLTVIAGAGDGQAAGYGAGITDNRSAYLNLGTAIVSGVAAKEYVTDASFRTLLGATDSYFLETDLKGGTFIITWLVEKLLGSAASEALSRIDELERAASGLPTGADGLVIVPYWNAVMNPYWDDDATGLALGLHGGHGAAHVYRAILEGIAFEQRLHTQGVEAALGKSVERFIVMGGGAKSRLWCQILADVLRRPILRGRSAEATSLGAAMLAALGTNHFSNPEHAVEAMTAVEDSFEPSDAALPYERLYENVYRHLYPSVRTAMGRLAELKK